MKNAVASLLEDDHESLGQLVSELNAELARPNVTRAFELLDLLWARLAVHIRAEHLHLFPALAGIPESLFTGRSNLPTPQEAADVLVRLRSDHDFFMKELAQLVKAMREMAQVTMARPKEVEDVRHRLTTLAKRLEAHNRLEEKIVYRWPEFLFDETTIVELQRCLRQELEKMPPRFG